VKALLLAGAIAVQPLANEDFLEPSVRHEVERALSRAPRPAPPVAPRVRREKAFLQLFATNGLTRTAQAIRLVSAQRADGRWSVGTNDVSAVAIERLLSL
jgi:hypothetical protein